MTKAVHSTKEDKYVTATLNPKERPNPLMVDDATNDDNSVVALSQQKMDELELFDGDTVLLKGKKHCETICIVLADDTCPNDHIRMNRVVQNNLRVCSSDIVSIEVCQDIKRGKRIYVLPIDDSVQGIAGNLLEVYLKPYFVGTYRPIKTGDVFVVRATIRTVEFKVIETDPSPYCIVAPDTVIHCEGDPIKREEEEASLSAIDYDDVGGLENVKQEIQEVLQYSVEHPEKILKFGMTPTRAVLFYGPPGCGKTLLVKAIANEYQMNFIRMSGPELLTMWFSESEANVRDIFGKARQVAPCVLFLDDLDSIAKSRNGSFADGGAADRVINQILTEIDGMSAKKNVFIIGATNRPDIIDSAFLRPGRFDHLIYIPLPDEKSRLDILKITLRKSPVAKDVDMQHLSTITNGFSGADLTEICHRACKLAIRELIEKEINEGKEQQRNGQTATDSNEPEDLVPEIRRDHFEEALKFARRSVSDNDIRKYEMFTQTLQQSRDFGTQFHFSDQQTLQGTDRSGGYRENCDDDDLYN
ncbi:unnamed protein product [Rotaria sordida]|uniref:vesicle-fusing ATPase n=2 Tax=Rotaria sordida TaxID=392033 RepID=A0A814ZMZ0_9BILA|nr:unnamed protein product [Rotaria sordida]